MKKELLSLIGALFTAVAATACCLPPLLFLLFGLSFGFLGFLENLIPFRIPLSLISLFLLWLSWRNYKCETLSCTLGKRKKYFWFYALFLGLIVAILLYPEVTNFLMERDE